MNSDEALQFIGRAHLIDPRITIDADRAQAWADILDDVPLDAALYALREHQRTSTDAVKPAHILAIVRRARAAAAERREHLALEQGMREYEAHGIPMPPEVRAELARQDAEREARDGRVGLGRRERRRQVDPEGLERARAELEAARRAQYGATP